MISGDGARLESRSKQAKAKAALSIKECCSISQRERERERERAKCFHSSARAHVVIPFLKQDPNLSAFVSLSPAFTHSQSQRKGP